MKKIKLLTLIILILLTCTGCTIEYNITVNKDTIEETIQVDETISSIRQEKDILEHYNMWYPTYVNYIPKGNETIELEDFTKKADGIEYHTKKMIPKNNGYNYEYTYTYPLNQYYDSYALATTFVETTVHNGTNTLVLKTSKENLLCKYNYFDSLKINIKVDPNVYKLNYTNSLNIRNNTYTWLLNRENCNDSQIILTLDSIFDTEDIIIKQEENKKDYTIYIFYGILIVIVIVGYLIYKKIKNKNENFDIDG